MPHVATIARLQFPATPLAAARPEAYHFADFSYLPAQALLLRAGATVAVGSRALDILECLLESAGHVVDKQALCRRVWPTTVVEEVSLRVHLAALRRALGDGQNGARYIVNAPGRGYRFVAVVQRIGGEQVDASDARLLIQALDLLADSTRLQQAIDALDPARLANSEAVGLLLKLMTPALAAA